MRVAREALLVQALAVPPRRVGELRRELAPGFGEPDIVPEPGLVIVDPLERGASDHGAESLLAFYCRTSSTR